MKTRRNTEKSPGPVGAASGRKRVGEVTAEERDEIRMLFERKNALLELFKTLAEAGSVNDAIYERVVADLGKVTTRFNEWWSAKSTQYQWENIPGWQWNIDFNDCSIYLAKP